MTTGLAVAKKVATLAPWVLTALFLGLSFLAYPLGLIDGMTPLAQGLSWLWLSIAVGWIWSIYRMSIAALGEQSRPAWIGWTFAAPPLIDTIAALANLSMYNSLPAFLFFAAFLYCIGQAANALEEADPGKVPGSVGKVLGTALLLYFSPVGVWMLRQRLLRVAARTA